jgi:hypothetical protein
MAKEQEELIDPTQPALVVVYGVTRRKRRPLLGNVVVVGRSAGCDIGIVSPEVAPVHCVLVRLADGWRIRDCSGRATRVNGQPVRDEPLRDGDVIQVGAFSFEAHLPPGEVRPAGAAAGTPAGEAKDRREHLERSRRRFARRALRLREQVREQARGAAELAQRQADLEQMERRLRLLHQENQAKQARQPTEGAVGPPDDDRARLDRRARELGHYARHVRRLEQRVRDREANLGRQGEEDRRGVEADLTRRAEREQLRELGEMRESVQQRQAELEETVAQFEEVVRREREQMEQERAHLVREREYLDHQRLELIRQREELEHRHSEGVTPAQSGTASTVDTWFDAPVDDRLASARRLLRDLSERRKAAAERLKSGGQE